MGLQPEMMSYAFNVHDEYFQPDPALPANEQYAIHPRPELEEFCAAAREHGVKPEVESFYTGAFWNLEYIRAQGLLDDPVWTTLFLGWPGGAWTPPTADSLLYLVRPPAAARQLELQRHEPDDAVAPAGAGPEPGWTCPRRLGGQPLPARRHAVALERRARGRDRRRSPV